MEAKFDSEVRKLRKARGLTQEELASKVNVSRETIHNIEKGSSIPNVLLAFAIAAILGVSAYLLFSKKEDKPNE